MDCYKLRTTVSWGTNVIKDVNAWLCFSGYLFRQIMFFFKKKFASELKIPLWRWQQMMIFMLANTIACIGSSVCLNIVDKKQVRIQLADQLLGTMSIKVQPSPNFPHSVNSQGGTLNRSTKRSPTEAVAQPPVDTAPLLNEVEDERSIN